MKTSKRKSTGQYHSAPTIHSPQLPHVTEKIRQRAHEIFLARGGTEGTALDDWLKAEQELQKQLDMNGQKPTALKGS